MSIPLTPQYDPKSLYTDGCSSAACQANLSAPNSLTQGRTFLEMNKALHGGRRSRKTSHSRKRSHRRRNTRRQRGGAADYPSVFGELLPKSMHAAADIGELDTAFGQLPSFVGKYGGVGGRRTRKHRGGGFGYTPGPTSGSAMILSPAEEPKAFLNPQWYTENQVVPSFQGPVNAFAQQSYNNQFNYAQRAGTRRKAHKGRKSSRKHKGSEGRKGRKGRKGSRRH